VTRSSRLGALPCAAVAVAVTAACALTSCGGGGGGGGAPASAPARATAPAPAPATTTTAAPAPATTAPPPAAGRSPADARRARTAVLRRADLPAGWTARPSGSGDVDDPACPDVRALRATATARAPSRSFSHGNESGIEQTVLVLPSAAAAARASGVLASAGTRRCLAVALGRRLGGGPHAVDPRRAKATPLPAGAPGTRAGAVALTFTYRGSFESDLRYELAVTRAGRALAVTSFLQLGNGFPARERERLERLTARRLRGAFGA
jgi:hypothetical protein